MTNPNKEYMLFCFGEHFVNGKKVDVFCRDNDGIPMTLEEIETRLITYESVLVASNYFDGCDYTTHVSTTDGQPDYLQGVVYADVMGQQILELIPLNEQDMVDTIIAEFEKNSKNDVLEFGDAEDIKATYWDENTGLTKHKPLTIVKRVDKYGNDQYDVECIAIDNLGKETNYVDNLDTIGYLILFNIYLCVTRK